MDAMTHMNGSGSKQHLGSLMSAKDLDEIDKPPERPIYFLVPVFITLSSYIIQYDDGASPSKDVIPYDNDTSPPDLSIIESTEHVNEFKFNDRDARKMLCRLIGLKEIPKLDSNAFKQLSGVIGDQIGDQAIDAVDAVRTMRDT